MNEYRFKFQIEKEDGEVLLEGSTYIGSVSDEGECESVDMEVGKYMRIFKKQIEKEKELMDDEVGKDNTYDR